MFADIVAEFAAQGRNARVRAIAARCRAPVAVTVEGRRGVGRETVRAALAGAGVSMAVDGRADVQVLVIAEAFKPEDEALLRSPAMVVLNKADLAGAEPGGPLVAAGRRAAAVATVARVPVVPMIAHLAAVEVDDADVVALRALAIEPANMTSTDAFVAAAHPVPAELRRSLLDKLDRFGLAHAILAVADGATADAVTEQLRGLSQTAPVLAGLAAVAAPVRYRRVCRALRELHTLAVQSGDSAVEEFLSCDEVVVAVMAAAVDVVQACGLSVDRGDDAAAHMRRAVRWRRYAHGPVNELHRRCGRDIARGSLRLLGASGG